MNYCWISFEFRNKLWILYIHSTLHKSQNAENPKLSQHKFLIHNPYRIKNTHHAYTLCNGNFFKLFLTLSIKNSQQRKTHANLAGKYWYQIKIDRGRRRRIKWKPNGKRSILVEFGKSSDSPSIPLFSACRMNWIFEPSKLWIDERNHANHEPSSLNLQIFECEVEEHVRIFSKFKLVFLFESILWTRCNDDEEPMPKPRAGIARCRRSSR